MQALREAGIRDGQIVLVSDLRDAPEDLPARRGADRRACASSGSRSASSRWVTRRAIRRSSRTSAAPPSSWTPPTRCYAPGARSRPSRPSVGAAARAARRRARGRCSRSSSRSCPCVGAAAERRAMIRRPSLRICARRRRARARGRVRARSPAAPPTRRAAFRARQAEWQRGLAPATPLGRRGRRSAQARTMLGIGARSDVLRAYQDYRAGLADVIEGTTYPQTRARFEAIRGSRTAAAVARSGPDRASADVVLGVVLADAASSAGPAAPESSCEARARRVRRAQCAATRRTPRRSSISRSLLAGDGSADEEPGPSLGLDQPTSGRATRTPATRPRPRGRKERDSEPMPPLARSSS